MFDLHGSIYPIRLVPSCEGTRLRGLLGAVPHLFGSEVLFAARPTSPRRRERHSPEFSLSSVNLIAGDHTLRGKKLRPLLAQGDGQVAYSCSHRKMSSRPSGISAIEFPQTIGVMWVYLRLFKRRHEFSTCLNSTIDPTCHENTD